MWDVVKALLKVKLAALNAYTRREKRSKISSLNFYLRKPEEEVQIVQMKTQASKRKEVRKIIAEISEMKNRKSIEKPQTGSLKKSIKLI